MSGHRFNEKNDLHHNDDLGSFNVETTELVKPISSDDTKKDHEIDPDRIDLNALWVVRRLRAKGYQAYLTGGCVRDLLLGIKPKDFDVATSARPEEVKAVFRNCRLIGRRFLLAHVVFPGGKIIETATFRANPTEDVSDDEALDDLLVMQDNVYGTIEEDAFRRDLTINGLFYDPVEGKVIDYVGGKEDLEKKIIRTIGDPKIRVQEDPVRILRVIRFAMRLGFSIEENTLSAMRTFAHDLLKCAPARLQEEIVKLLTSGHAKDSIKLALEVGALAVLMPELLLGMGISSDQENTDDDEIMQYWYAILNALDDVKARDCHIVSSVAFTALLLPAYGRLEKQDTNERNWIDSLCVSWAERIRLTRRDQDVIRVLLSAIPLFSLDKVHHKSAQYLVRKPWFREGLLIYILHLWAKGESLEQIKVWKVLAQEADKLYKQDKYGQRTISRFRKKRIVRHQGRYHKESF